MKRYRQGLVVGKFCPLHRGHMHVINAALDASDEVVVISYTKPEFDRCGPATRDAWIAGLFPQVKRLVIDDELLQAQCASLGIDRPVAVPMNDAPDAVHREFTAWLCWTLAGTVADAVFTSEGYGDDFAAALSGYFSAQTGRQCGVAHVCVDQARRAIPVSGTSIRSDPHGYRAFLHPLVYADFVERVCILGGESSGKTTLVEALAQALDTICVPEVGRLRWEEKAGKLEYHDMQKIVEAQLDLEVALSRQARRWLICDGTALTTEFYSEDSYGKVDPVVRTLAQRRYAATFVCAPDFPFVQDGTRRDAAFRQRQHQWYLNALDRAGVDYVVLAGTLAQRVDTAVRLLG